MALLGAELSDLEALAAELGQAGDRIGNVAADAQRIQVEVSAQLNEAFASAIGQISGATDELSTAVGATRARLDATTWTGANRMTFESAALDFDAAMTSLAAAVQQSYEHFQAELQKITGFMETFQGEVAAGLDDARASTGAMQQAVQVQHANLDAAMNGTV